MKRAIFLSVLAAILFVGGMTAGAQSTTPTGTWTVTGYGLYGYWLYGFVPSGASVDILYTGVQAAPGLGTIIEDDPGAGWQTSDFYVNANGTHYVGPFTGSNPTTYDQAEFLNDLGVRQGIVWNPEQKRNLLEAFLFYRFRYDHNSQTVGETSELLFSSGFPESTEILSNALLAGLSFNTVVQDEVHKTQGGIYGEASVEWAPNFLFNSIGGADYYRLNATLKAYQTLFTSSTPDGSANLFSGFLADYVGVDYAGGASVPSYVFESFGGRYIRAENATTIHGLDDGNYPIGLKLINNLELRVVGPAIVWRDLVPAMFAFLDTAYDTGYLTAGNTLSGVRASTGAGIYVDFFELANLNLYFAYPLSDTRTDGAAYSIGAAFNLAF